MNTATQLTTSDLPALLSPLGGGFFAGVINIHGQPHALVIAPKADGEFADVHWGAYGERIEGADSYFDGLANTDAMAAAGNTAAQKIRALRIGGCDDWHIPARDALELAYRNGKPTDEENFASFRDGDNPSSVPAGYPYTETSPAQCANVLFQEGGAEAFEPVRYWSSTQYSARFAWLQLFDDGYQDSNHKGYEGRVRAVRTIPLSH